MRWKLRSLRARARSSSAPRRIRAARCRSEEHTSELQSQSNLECRLLLEKNSCTGLIGMRCESRCKGLLGVLDGLELLMHLAADRLGELLNAVRLFGLGNL